MTISHERLARLIEYFDQYAVNEVDETIREESLGALRELQQLRTCHREVICRRYGLRDQLRTAPESPMDEPEPLF